MESKTMSVGGAMKVLNMTKFDAEELNEKFNFRVRSVAQGLGGSLRTQKDIYKSWEYLNRMLARESSTNTENVLRKADKMSRIYEKPKPLDIIPFKFSNPARKASLIIEKTDKRKKPEKEVKSILKVQKPGLMKSNLPPLRTLMLLEAQKVTKAGGRASKRVSWKDDENLDEISKPIPSKKGLKPKSALLKPVFVKREGDLFHQKQAVCNRTGTEDGFEEGVNLKEKLPKLLGELPKLQKLQTTPFKRVVALNEIFASPKKISRHDQWSAGRRILWKEESSHILKGLGTGKRKQSLQASGKNILIPKMRKSLQKQEDVLYRRFDESNNRATDISSENLVWKRKPENLRYELYLTGLYTPSRINNWMESSEHLSPE